MCVACYLKNEAAAPAAAPATNADEQAMSIDDTMPVSLEDMEDARDDGDPIALEQLYEAGEEEEEALTQATMMCENCNDHPGAGEGGASSDGKLLRRAATRFNCPAGCCTEVAFVRFPRPTRA